MKNKIDLTRQCTYAEERTVIYFYYKIELSLFFFSHPKLTWSFAREVLKYRDVFTVNTFPLKIAVLQRRKIQMAMQ